MGAHRASHRPSPRLRAGRPGRGFTLIEVLVALAIISIALAAFVRITSQTVGNQGHLERQSLALLSAQNSLAELRIGSLPPPGLRQVDCPQGELAFVCRVQIAPSRDGMRAVAVDVYLGRDSDRSLASLQSRLPESRR
ncbi:MULTISPECIES: type II secretion system minor pseudopilin GspI [Variovorax]|jgi:general secretion pathway protein I|uniref:type II secretion system minor pseudopilin GspI n=1 Tax=Variovorax TaxID=34072 RepID=UPI00122AAD80|nr:type II secretion system minor pseudopilin GspI [Variovorax sp.]TAJ58121.1 MAG: type II secretion system protein GspI [Variovorax sp.]